MSIFTLSKKSGVSKSMISNIELNQKHPTLPILLALAKALKTAAYQACVAR